MSDMLEITEAAAEILERAYQAAARFNPDARIRVYRVGDRVETGFSDRPAEGDQVVEHGELTIFVSAGIEGILDSSEEHSRLIVR